MYRANQRHDIIYKLLKYFEYFRQKQKQDDIYLIIFLTICIFITRRLLNVINTVPVFTYHNS